MCKCPLELEKRKKKKRIFIKKKKKRSKDFSSFHAKIVVEGFLVEYRKKPGLSLCTFLHRRSRGLGGQQVTGWPPVLGNGVGAQHRALVGLKRELLGQDPILQQASIAFGLFGRKLSYAEDKLQASQLDVAAMV